jgi:ribosomal protein L37E
MSFVRVRSSWKILLKGYKNMRVQCPKCKANYNIDISKIPAIPEGGITTTCPKCKGKIPISIDKNKPEPESGKSGETAVIIPCPQCGHFNVSAGACAVCGKIFTKEEIESLKITIGE